MTEHPFNNDATAAEREAVIQNDRRVARERSTYHQFAQSEADTARGRYTAHEKSTVVGSTPAPNYPAAFLQRDPVPDEPALGVDLNEMPPTGEVFEVERSIQQLGGADMAPASASLPCAVETAAPPPPTDDDEPPRAA